MNVRQGPGTTHPVLFQAEQGEEFPLIKTEGLWCLIQLQGEDQAWVFARLVDVIPGEIAKRGVETPEPEPVKPATSLKHKAFKAILYLALVLFIFYLIGKRRRILEKIGFKLREASGYDREKPFRYDDHQPRDDSWEL
ncbi:MAG: SH3 domain-containing protein [Proteobacteria bacterium]|nr:SH3 domain-containing protein [Pseudomonadota bacterium]